VGAAGSWRSSTLAGRRAAAPLVFAALLLVLYAAGLPAALVGALPWSLAARAGLCVALVLPLAAALGVALPLGLAALPGGAAVPWAWGINGAASAVGATLATMAAMEWGLSVVLAGAAGCYFAAAALLGGRAAGCAQMFRK